MRSPLLVALALILLIPPAQAQKPDRKLALAAIEKALVELPLGTPFDTVKKRPGFEYFEDLELIGARVDGVGIFASFHDEKLSRLAIDDLSFAHPQLAGILEKNYGKPVTTTVGKRTTHVFKKEGESTITLILSGNKRTSLEVSAPEKQ